MRPRFKNVPTAVSIVPGKPGASSGSATRRLENITGPALVISNEIQRPDPDQPAKRRLQGRAGPGQLPRERQDRRGGRAGLRGRAVRPTACTSPAWAPSGRSRPPDGPRGNRPAGAGGIGHPRPARSGDLGQRPNARRDRRRQDRRHRGPQGGDCEAPDALSADGMVLRQRHADAPAGHRADRPAILRPR